MFEISIKIDKSHKIWESLKNSTSPALMMAGHVGTHTDVYLGSEVPQEYLERNGVLVDCKGYPLKKGEIGMEAIKNVDIKEGDFVIFNTGYLNEYPYACESYFIDHPVLTWELIDFLISKKVSFIGIDCAGIRLGKEHREADERCERAGTYVIENLSSEALTMIKGDFDVVTVWTNNPLLSGLSTKVFAKNRNE